MSTAGLYTIAKRWKSSMPVNRWMNKQSVVHTSTGILVHLTKEGNLVTYNTDESGGYYAKWNKPPQKDK
jgi:hypothetical protein